MGVNERFLKDIAAESSYTLDELKEADEKLEKALQGELLEHFKKSRLQSGPDYWLLEDGGGVWLVFNMDGIEMELQSADVEYDYDKIWLVAYASLDEFQSKDLTVAVPGTVARSRKKHLYFPIYVRFPEEWQRGEQHAMQRLQELVSRYEMSPSEAMDWWAVQLMDEKPTEWARKRNIQPEGVRKNVRQAKEKLQDDDLGATHENGQFRPVSTDEIPAESPHDEDEDVFYVPTQEAAEEMEL